MTMGRHAQLISSSTIGDCVVSLQLLKYQLTSLLKHEIIDEASVPAGAATATEHVQSSNLLHVVLHSYGWLQCNIYVHLVSVGSINHCRIWCLKDSILYHCQWDDIPGGEMNKHKRWSFHLTGFQMCSMSAI